MVCIRPAHPVPARQSLGLTAWFDLHLGLLFARFPSSAQAWLIPWKVSKSLRGMLGQWPWRFVFSASPWRALLYTVTGMVWALPFSFGDRAGVLLPFLPVLAIGVSVIERRRVRLLGDPAIPSGHLPIAAGARRRWLLIRLGEATTWRETGYTALTALLSLGSVFLLYGALTLLVVLFAAPVAVAVYQPITLLGWTAATPWAAWPLPLLGLLLIVLVLYAATVIAWVQAALARTLLGPRELELHAQIESLHLSRKMLLHAVEGERSRIERDLHDGVQQHMVTLAMQLGTLELELHDLRARGADVQAATATLDAARASSDDALAAMRRALLDLKPPTLTEYGLPNALRELADAAPIPTTFTGELPTRFAPDVEQTAYLFASEACTNAMRHSEATRVQITAKSIEGSLQLRVQDDGRGGAALRPGGGLTGLRERADIIGGTLRIDSPQGGPTTLVLQVPAHPEKDIP